MPLRKKKQAHKPPPLSCSVKGCLSPGEYKAPRSRIDLRNYQWFCLEHVREFNRAWDYFKGMTADQIETFRQDALHGHRPTWRRDAPHGKEDHTEKLHEELERFFRWDSRTSAAARNPHLLPKERKALATLELDGRLEPEALKRHYRALVKRTHPDLHSGDRDYEERFKQITAAYAYLEKLYSPEGKK